MLELIKAAYPNNIFQFSMFLRDLRGYNKGGLAGVFFFYI